MRLLNTNNDIQLSRHLRHWVALFLGVLLTTATVAQENCTNGIDDDGDGLIDLNDDDCVCTGFGGSQNVSSLIPNSSFEDRSCCPSSYSQLGCADSWIQASEPPTSDYWHTCGQQGNTAYGLPATPLPDGNGYVGFYNNVNWQEYVGACLLAPMAAGTTYELNFYLGGSNSSPPFNLTIYGSPNCGDLPFNSNGCPVGLGSWVQLAEIPMTGGNVWVNETVTFTPTQNINAVVIGGGCGQGTSPYSYYYLDGLSLNSTDLNMVLHLDRTGRWCDNDIVLHATKDTIPGTYQWFKDGIAIAGETGDDLNVSANGYGAGDYSVMLLINGQCETQTVTVQAADQPQASATFSDVCFPDDVSFTDQSTVATGNITDWYWDFGDSQNSTLPSPTNDYINAGTFNVELTVTTDSGCTATFNSTVTVAPKPDAQFYAEDQCLGNLSNFLSLSDVDAPDNINYWEWDFGDSNTSLGENTVNNYATDGSYDVRLIVETNNGCRDTITNTINVYPTPVPDFSFDTVCAASPTTFANNSSINSGTIDVYTWDFGSGNSVLQNPTFTFTPGGQYDVELLIESDQGCKDSLTHTVPVHPNPVADFDFTEVCFNTITDFTDLSTVATGSIDEWDWDFGDLNTDVIADPQNLYGNAGTYDVTLIVTTDNNCTDDTTQQLTVYDLPVADFTFTNQCLDTEVDITDLSTIPTGSINTWEWDLGDLTLLSVQDPLPHLYPNPGTYDIELMVTSGNDCKDTLVQQVEVYPMPAVDFRYHNVCFGEENQFTDLTVLLNAQIADWDWSFGDAGTSDIENPTHTYLTHGEYDVTLKIQTEHGCDGDTTHTVIVNPLPTPSFEFTEVCLNETTDFIDQTTIDNGSFNRWNWNFGDATSSNTQNPSHLYLLDGVYDVSLVVTSDSLCVDSITQEVTVFPLPDVQFTADKLQGCQPLEVGFIDQSTVSSGYNVSQWIWEFGNGNGTNSQFPASTYQEDGTYSVTLTAITNEGCKATESINNMITVWPVPRAFFLTNPQPTTIKYPFLTFTDGSSSDVIEWQWDFGDGNVSIEQNAEHEYLDTGYYPVEQIVVNNYGCLDTALDTIYIGGAFTFYIPNTFTPNSDGINDHFYGSGIGIVSYEMRIFNRWGELVYFSTSPEDKWDGTVRGNTKQVQMETYIYKFDLLDVFGEEHFYTGRVSLVR